ncbi:MAG: hypothetical protein KA133_02275 [Flavobacterium sp.]|nr:hypothetical protein [Flavobacterium sp.]
MKTKTNLTVVLFLFNLNILLAQEWRNYHTYKRQTGYSTLKEGCWLKRDRKKQTIIWQQANVFNLHSSTGYLPYKSIRQISDFYNWFDIERKKQGHEILWIGISSIATGQLAKIENFGVRTLIVNNKNIVQFANDGSQAVLKYAFPYLKKVYFSTEIIKDSVAKNWDLEFGQKEQCIVLESCYQKLTSKEIQKLERMAKGKGVFYFAIPKKLIFEGNVENCNDRFEHGLHKMIPYYKSQNPETNKEKRKENIQMDL